MVSDKKIFKDFKKFSVATRVFEGIKFFQKNSEEDHGRNISVKFDKNPIGSFREDI